MTRAQKKRLNLLLPNELAQELEALVPPRQRGRVVSEVLARELRRLRVLSAIEQSAGAWSGEAHPELTTGKQIDRWIASERRRLRWDRHGRP
jgi:hypothetical protein